MWRECVRGFKDSFVCLLMTGSGTKTPTNIPRGLIKRRCDPVEGAAAEVILVTTQKRPAN